MQVSGWALSICFVTFMNVTAAARPAQAESYKNVQFSHPEGVSLRLDASVPEGAGPFPAAIIVHGGGWVRGDRRIDVAPLFQPLSDAGIAWFSIDYRLATDPLHFGAAIDDVVAAIRFVKEHAEEYHIDPDRIALIGESAGGQLAAMAALNGEPGTAVKAVVGIYAPTDLVALAKDSELIPDAIRARLQGTPFEGLILARLAQLSPIEKVRRGMPPFLLIHGTADPVVPFEQSKAMCGKMLAVGGECTVFPVPGGGHGIRRWEYTPSTEAPYKREMIRWLRAELAENPVRAL
jgi:acetyl esterase